eukprot:COSAG02_NODE_2051_length_10000_cov_2.340471_13_plen_85_part_00
MLCRKLPGTCKGVHTQCIRGICQAPGVAGGEACGHWGTVDLAPAAPITYERDLNKLKLGGRKARLVIKMWASDLYSTQFVCEAA